MKPLFNIKEVSINRSCNEDSLITVEFTLHQSGPARICFDIPAAIPVFFKSTGANSLCHIIPNPNVGHEQNISITLVFEATKKDHYTFILSGHITDSEGNTRSDYVGVNLICL